MSANHPHSGARVSVATAPTRERVLEFGAQSCALCEKACGAALLRVGAPSGRAYTPPLVEALRSCRRLMKINADLLRERSPLYGLMSAACTAAAVLVCKACEIILAQGPSDVLLKEVGDSCWIAAHACRDIVSAAAKPGP